jgi:hypothetical protein
LGSSLAGFLSKTEAYNYEMCRASMEGWFPRDLWAEMNQTWAGLGQLLVSLASFFIEDAQEFTLIGYQWMNGIMVAGCVGAFEAIDECWSGLGVQRKRESTSNMTPTDLGMLIPSMGPAFHP